MNNINKAPTCLSSELSKLQKDLNALYHSYALSTSPDKLKPLVKPIVTELNKTVFPWLDTFQAASYEDKLLKKRVGKLCQTAIELYNCVLKNDKGLMATDEKLIWMASKISYKESNSQGFYPVFDESVGVFVGGESGLDSRISKLEVNDKKERWMRCDVDLSDTDGVTDLFQDSLYNCSFVSSVLSVMNLDFKLLLKLIHTTDQHSTKNDSFGIVFIFNGAKRVVFVDNQIPVDDQFCVKSLSNDSLLWPALIEKAYLQINGVSNFGQFSGSNFANDTFMLTGFIPEYISVDELNSGILDTIYQYFKGTKVVLGLGTGDLTKDERLHYKLIPRHDYSVVDMLPEDTLNTQFGYIFVVKNPWSLKGDKDGRSFRVGDLYYFNGLYMNWDPSKLFNYTQQLNFFATGKSKQLDNKSFIDEVQFNIKNLSSSINGNEVWVLVERHISELLDPKNRQSISLRVEWFEVADGEKVWSKSSNKCILKTLNNDSRFSLSKINLKAGQSVTGVFLVTNNDSGYVENQGHKRPLIFSLYVYSKFPVRVKKATNRYKHLMSLEGYWSPSQTGGNWSFPTFINNPQFELSIPGSDGFKKVAVDIGLFSNEGKKVNFLVFQTKKDFRFLTEFNERLLVCEQGLEYDNGFQVKNLSLEENRRYVIIASTYGPNEYDTFRISVNSNTNFELSKIPQSLGLFTRSIPFIFASDTMQFTTKFRLPRTGKITLKVQTNKKLSIVARLVNLDNMSVVCDSSEDDKGTGFRNYFYGLFLGGFEISGGEYQLTVEKLENSEDKGCVVDIGTSVMLSDI